MAHGVARDIADIPRYYAHIRHGQPVSPAVQQELVDRYRAIGGHSPLGEVTEQLAAGTERVLDARNPGAYRVFVGFRHSEPFIGDVVQEMAAAGVEDAVGIALAPHYSHMSTDLYMAAAEAGLEVAGRPFELRPVRQWHDAPGLVELLADRVTAARTRLPDAVREACPVVFTAHSLPRRILETDDPYRDQLQETADLVARALGLPRYEIGWQSAGRTREPWLGPDILERMRELAAEGAPGLLVCPCGFTSDHLEVLYDLDIAARQLADDLGLAFERTASLNDDPRFQVVLADLVERVLTDA